MVEPIPLLVKITLIDESSHSFFEIGEHALGGKGDCSGRCSIFKGEMRGVGELGELVVVIRVPNARHGVCVNPLMGSMLHHVH